MTSQARSHAGWRSAVPELPSRKLSGEASLAFVLAGFAGWLYRNGGFVWDDGPLIAQRLAQADVGQLLALWTSPVTDSGPGAAYYRPVSLTILGVWGRLGPYSIHLFAAFVHALSAWLMVQCCSRSRMALPFWGAMAFALHPLASEVLGWSSALPDALAVALGLLAVYVGAERPKLRFLFLLVGVLSKETALLIPIAFMVGERRWVGWIRPWVAALLVAGVLRINAGVSSSLDWVAKLDLLPSAMGWAIGALAWPFPQHAVRDLHVAPLGTVILGWVVVFGLFWGARRRPEAMGGAILVVLAHLVAMPVVLDGYLLGERYSYPALVGLGVWVATMFQGVSLPKKWLGLPVFLLLGNHVAQVDRWKKDLKLFDRVETHAHGSSYAWHLLGVAQMNQSLFADAVWSFEGSIRGGNPYPGDRTLLLQALVLSGEPAEALAAAETGPTEDLTAQHVAWWARAAFEAGNIHRSRELLQTLKVGNKFDGPEWVPGLAGRVFRSDEAP